MLGEKIKLYRESKNMTQAEVAEILGVKAATISKYEAGTLEPNIESLKKLAELFGVSIDELLKDEERQFDIKENNVVIFPDGDFITNKVYYDSSSSSYQTLYQGATITDGYIDELIKYTEERLEISNSIIVYDLIKKEENRGLIDETTVQN